MAPAHVARAAAYLLEGARGRLEQLAALTDTASPAQSLRLAQELRANADLLNATARALSSSAFDDLGRFAAEVVAEAERDASPGDAAERVADAFLALHR